MPIMPDFIRKKIAKKEADAAAAEGESTGESESPSDIDAPKKTGGKMNPLMKWAAARAKG